MRAMRPSAAVPADPMPPPGAPPAERLAWLFRRNGVVRRPAPTRRAAEGKQYKKGYEVRLVALSPDELAVIRELLRAAGFINLGHPFRKAGRVVQPLYGKAAVARFLSLVEAAAPDAEPAAAADGGGGCVRRRAFRMNRRSARDVVLALYGAGDTNARIDALSCLVIDLLVEVEALRGAVLGPAGTPVHGGYDIPCHDKGLTAGKGPYPAAYVDAAYVRHNAAGPSGGVEKLLARFYPAGGGEPREALMLRRLGFSDAEVARFADAAGQAEQFS